jgi:PAS domain S-box-containing protein
MMVDAALARRALKNGEFVPYFQPLVALRTGELAGFEVLARWRHPTLGVILPDQFIPLAQRDGWIGALTQEVLRTAFEAASAIPERLVLAVNISPLQLRDPGLPGQIRGASELAGYSLGRLVIEITESALNDNLEQARTIAQELKTLGCRLALDDFGTGYSSLLHLQSLPFDELKVDRSFVSSMTDRRGSRKIVAAVVGLGQSLGLTTVAEGIETREQAEMLLWMGCEMGQGWLYGRPAPAEELPRLISAPRNRLSTGLPRPGMSGSVSQMDTLPGHRLAQLQAVFDGSPAGLCFLDRNVRYVNLNRRLADMNGFSVEEHLGRTVAEMLPEFFPQFEHYILRALGGEAIAGVEVKRPGSGINSERILLASYQPARDEAGEVVGVSVAVMDITERKRAEEALRESEAHYRHMVDLNPQTPWIMNPEGLNLDVSPRWEQTTGQTKEQTRNLGWLDALHPDDRQRTADALAACVRSGQELNVAYRVRTAEGHWRWMRSRGSPRFDAQGNVMFWYGGVEDIDEQIHVEEALRKSEAQLKALFNAVPVGVILADSPDGTVSMANPEARRIFRDSVLPGPNLQNYAQWGAARADGKVLESAEYPLARALLHGETTQAEEVFFRRGKRNRRWVNLSGAPVRTPDEEIMGGVLILQDIDAVKRERQHLISLAKRLTKELQAYDLQVRGRG